VSPAHNQRRARGRSLQPAACRCCSELSRRQSAADSMRTAVSARRTVRCERHLAARGALLVEWAHFSLARFCRPTTSINHERRPVCGRGRTLAACPKVDTSRPTAGEAARPWTARKRERERGEQEEEGKARRATFGRASMKENETKVKVAAGQSFALAANCQLRSAVCPPSAWAHSQK